MRATRPTPMQIRKMPRFAAVLIVAAAVALGGCAQRGQPRERAARRQPDARHPRPGRCRHRARRHSVLAPAGRRTDPERSAERRHAGRRRATVRRVCRRLHHRPGARAASVAHAASTTRGARRASRCRTCASRWTDRSSRSRPKSRRRAPTTFRFCTGWRPHGPGASRTTVQRLEGDRRHSRKCRRCSSASSR